MKNQHPDGSELPRINPIRPPSKFLFACYAWSVPATTAAKVEEEMRLGNHLVRKGLVSAEQMLRALDLQMKKRIPIGQLAVQTGHLTVGQVFKILSIQAEQRRRFGQIAVELGFLSKRGLEDLLAVQTLRSPSLGDILVSMGAIDRAALRAEEALNAFSDIDINLVL
jgi:hypothetical protein